MAVGMQAGILVGALYGVLHLFVPQPIGAVIYWLLQTLHLSAYTAVTWHRTRLYISTLGGTAATLASGLLLGLHAAGHTWESIPTAWTVPLCGLMVLVPVCVLGESCLHRGEWTEWRAHVESMGLWDMLMLRHIPTLTRPED